MAGIHLFRSKIPYEYVYYIFFIYSSRDGCFINSVCLHFLAFVNSATINMVVQMFLQHSDIISFRYNLCSGINEFYGSLIFIYLFILPSFLLPSLPAFHPSFFSPSLPSSFPLFPPSSFLPPSFPFYFFTSFLPFCFLCDRVSLCSPQWFGICCIS
jgi:hypothetical protein